MRKILILLLVLVILPLAIFVYVRFNTLSESERVIKSVYERQFNSVTFSINQHALNIFENWRSKINSGTGGLNSNSAVEIISSNESVQDIIYFDLVDDSVKYFSKPENNEIELADESQIKLQKLKGYFDKNYGKIESLALKNSENKLLVFVRVIDDKAIFCALIINPEKFIENRLVPQIKVVESSEFIVEIFSTHLNANKRLYPIESKVENAFTIKTKLWQFKDYEIRVSLKQQIYDEIVQSRSGNTLIILIVSLTILMISAYYVYRITRKELLLAKMKSDFVANVSHELRTPLSLISMFAETLEMERVPNEEKKMEYYSIIHQETGRLSKIVNSILNFSKIESGKRKYKIERIDLSSVIKNLMKNYEFHLENKGFTFEASIKENVYAKIDKEAISECFINLLDNAMKYSHQKKHIVVSVGTDNSRAYFEIKDFGIGISKEHKSKIMDEFFRVTEGEIHNVKGTGLGLSIVKKIVEAHKAELKIESEPENGSKFRIVFNKDFEG